MCVFNCRLSSLSAPFSIAIFTLLLSYPLSSMAISIDSMTGAQQVSSQGGSNITNRSAINSQASIGGTRTIEAVSTGGFPSETLSAAIPSPGDQRYKHSQDDGVIGQSQIIWDGNTDANSVDFAGLGGIDLTEDGGTAFTIEDLTFDFAFGGSIALTLTIYDASDTSGDTYSAFTLTLTTFVTLQDIAIPFDTPTSQGPQGPADLTNIGAITLLIDGVNPGIDLSFDNLTTNGFCPLTPGVGGQVLDECGECIPPTDPDYNQSCLDCLGVPNGNTLPGDSCDTGEEGPCAPGIYENDCSCKRVMDPTVEICDGVDNNCNGEIDETFPQIGLECGITQGECDINGVYICDELGGSKCDIDLDLSNFDDCDPEIGCDGIPGSQVLPDDCGICGGDGSTCAEFECESTDVSELLFTMDQAAKQQEALVRSITKIILRRSNKKRDRAFVAQIRERTNDLQVANWILSWTFPIISVQCDSLAAAEFCVNSDNTVKINSYIAGSEALRDIGLESVRRLRKVTRNRNLVKRWRKRLAKKHSSNLVVVDQIPKFQSVCTSLS